MRAQDGLGSGKVVTCLWHDGTSPSFMAENDSLCDLCVCERRVQEAFGKENGAENQCVGGRFY